MVLYRSPAHQEYGYVAPAAGGKMRRVLADFAFKAARYSISHPNVCYIYVN